MSGTASSRQQRPPPCCQIASGIQSLCTFSPCLFPPRNFSLSMRISARNLSVIMPINILLCRALDLLFAAEAKHVFLYSTCAEQLRIPGSWSFKVNHPRTQGLIKSQTSLKGGIMVHILCRSSARRMPVTKAHSMLIKCFQYPLSCPSIKFSA